MSTLTPKQVGDEMSIYTFRPGTPMLEKKLTGGRLYCFDKGHLRIAGSVPPEFVAVPEQVILEFFGTKYTLNIRKLERAIEDYAKAIKIFRRGGVRPRRPTIRSLYLETPSDFELFLRPLDSFYCGKLKQNFSNVLNVVEKRGDWRGKVNNYATVTGVQRLDRWRKATVNGAHKIIHVRLNNFNKMTAAPLKDIPTLIYPYPPSGTPQSQQREPKLSMTNENKEEIQDIDMLERTNMGRSRKYRKVLIRMAPWQESLRVGNPFKSKAYREAYLVAQISFEQRYAKFKKDIDTRRSTYRKEWAAYKAFKDDQKSFKQTVPYVEKPDAVEFEREWKEFIFGLKQEMKNIEFEPIRDTVEGQDQVDVTVPDVSTNPMVVRSSVPAVSETVVVKHVEPVAKPPRVLPSVVMEQPSVPVVHEVIHTLDPVLLMIERDLRYSKRVMAK
jgi:hypothetical protein